MPTPDPQARSAAITYVLRQSFCIRCRAAVGKVHTCNPSAYTLTVRFVRGR